NTLRSTHSTYPSVHAVGLAEPCAKTNRRRPPQPALCPKAPAALKPAAKIAKTHPPQTQICHGISAREKCRLKVLFQIEMSGVHSLTTASIDSSRLARRAGASDLAVAQNAVIQPLWAFASL